MSMRPMWTMLNRAVTIRRHTPSNTPIKTLTGNNKYVSRNKFTLQMGSNIRQSYFAVKVVNLRANKLPHVNHLLSKSLVPAIFFMKQNLQTNCWNNTVRRIINQNGLRDKNRVTVYIFHQSRQKREYQRYFSVDDDVKDTAVLAWTYSALWSSIFRGVIYVMVQVRLTTCSTAFEKGSDSLCAELG